MADLTKREVERVQRALNDFTEKHLRGVQPLIVDGDKGAATDKRIRQAKFWLGFKVPTGAGVGKLLVTRLKEPKNAKHFPDRGYVKRGRERRTEQRAEYRKQKRDA